MLSAERTEKTDADLHWAIGGLALRELFSWVLLGELVLLFSGCATPSASATYMATNGQVSAPAPQPVEPPPGFRLPNQVQPPVRPAPSARPPVPVGPGSAARAPESIVTRLLTAPVLVLAVLLYPSELGDGTLHQDWRNTLSPVTRKPWSSQQEYDEFWQLPLHERGRRIQESRDSMKAPGGAGAEPVPQGMPSKDERIVDPLEPFQNRVAPGRPENKPSLAPGARASALRVAASEEFRELVEKTIIENFRDQQGFETVDAWTVVSISKPQVMSSDSPDPSLGPSQERYYVEIHDSFTKRNYTVSVNWDPDLERFGVIKLSSGKNAKKNR